MFCKGKFKGGRCLLRERQSFWAVPPRSPRLAASTTAPWKTWDESRCEHVGIIVSYGVCCILQSIPRVSALSEGWCCHWLRKVKECHDEGDVICVAVSNIYGRDAWAASCECKVCFLWTRSGPEVASALVWAPCRRVGCSNQGICFGLCRYCL